MCGRVATVSHQQRCDSFTCWHERFRYHPRGTARQQSPSPSPTNIPELSARRPKSSGRRSPPATAMFCPRDGSASTGAQAALLPGTCLMPAVRPAGATGTTAQGHLRAPGAIWRPPQNLRGCHVHFGWWQGPFILFHPLNHLLNHCCVISSGNVGRSKDNISSPMAFMA